MSDPLITCPSCKTEIKLTESLAGPLLEATRQQYEARLKQKEADIAKRETAIRGQAERLDEQLVTRLSAERKTIAAEEAKRARLTFTTDIERRDREVADLNKIVLEGNAKLAEAQKAQADFLKKERQLDDERRELSLTIERRVQASLSGVRDQAKREAEDSLALKVREKEEQIASMGRQIEDLKKKAEQGSQQLQGEVLEIELEALLTTNFPRDQIASVPKGELGGDVIQKIFNNAGQHCGSILWEVKRTKNWSDAWLAKLRDDQRRAKADAAFLVSSAKPKGIDLFDCVDGVWVTDLRCAVPVALAVRESIVALAAARQNSTGLTTKSEQVYQYLTGPRFKHHIGAMVEKLSELQNDLERERRAMTKSWAKRDQLLRSVFDAAAGVYGDLQGISGQSMEDIEGLDVPLLDAPPKKDAA